MKNEEITALALLSLGVILLMTPLIRFVSVGWKAKRRDIVDGLNEKARDLYCTRFLSSSTEKGGAPRQFETLYSEWYGRRLFVVPGALQALTAIVAVAAVVLTGLDRLGYLSNPVVNLPPTALAALSGAYLWVLNDHIARARRLDFSPSDSLWAALRLVVSVPMGYSFSYLLAKEIAPFVAFAAGCFPLSGLVAMIRNIAEKKLGFEASKFEIDGSTLQLQGVNKAVAERLANEDIETIVQLAYCDPVRVVMRTSLTFSVVTDLMSQALAWIYFEDTLSSMRRLGLRGAVEIADLVNRYDNEDADDHEAAVKTLKQIATELAIDPAILRHTLGQISEDPYAVFLCEIWV